MTQLHLAGAVADVPRAAQPRAAAFWAAALGLEPKVSERLPEYAQFLDATPGFFLLVQATGDATARVHLDLHAPDRDNEVERIAQLGATATAHHERWTVMASPAGVVFCVVVDPHGPRAADDASATVSCGGGHRSRLCAALADVPRATFQREVGFWRDVLQREPAVDPDDPDYVSFGTAAPGVEFMVQAVGDDTSRVHLDIETDDIDAEVARLVDAGAAEVARIEPWVVLRDPAGNLFCVVRVQQPADFAAHAKHWPR